MKKKWNRTSQNSIINADDERRENKERNVKNARYTSRRKLPMHHLENDGDQMWSARNRAAMDMCPGCLAVLLQLDDNGWYTCSLPGTAGRLLRTRKNAKVQTMHNSFEVRGVQSTGSFFVVTGGVSADLFFTLGSHIYIDYYSEQKLLRTAVGVEEV